MSGKSTATAGPVMQDGDAGMDDILASIRRILEEDELAIVPMPAALADQQRAAAETLEAKPAAEPAVEVPSVAAVAEVPAFSPAPVAAAEPEAEPLALTQEMMVSATNSTTAQVTALNVQTPSALLSPNTSAATAASVGELIRAVSADRGATVSRSGTTIEDIVREEMRPMIKDWLDNHLPGMVERLVRVEIERVVSRAMV